MDKKLGFLKKKYFLLEGNLHFQAVDDLFDNNNNKKKLHSALQ